MIFWFSGSMMNYMMNFYIKYIHDVNIFALASLAACAEILSKSVNGVVLSLWGFKNGTYLILLIGFVSALLFLTVSA